MSFRISTSKSNYHRRIGSKFFSSPLLFPITLSLFLLFFFVGTSADPETLEIGKAHSTVQVLTENNIDEALSDPANGLWFLKYYGASYFLFPFRIPIAINYSLSHISLILILFDPYVVILAPWCAHCKKMAPTLEKMAVYLEGKMAIGKIDCTQEKRLCKVHDVRGYPTLKFHRDGETLPYQGKRDADSMIDFAEHMNGRSVEVRDSYEDVLNILNGGVGFVAYDKDASDGKKGKQKAAKIDDDGITSILSKTHTLKVFRQVARMQQAEATFILLAPGTPKSELRKFRNINSTGGDSAFVVRVEAGTPPSPYDRAEINTPDLYDFVRAGNVPLVVNLESHNFRDITDRAKESNKNLLVAAVDPNDATAWESTMQDMKQHALMGMDADMKDGDEPLSSSSFSSSFVFAVMDGVKWAGFLSQFDIGTQKDRENEMNDGIKHDSKPLPDMFVLDSVSRKYWKRNDLSDDYQERRLSGPPPYSSETMVGSFLNDLARSAIIEREWTGAPGGGNDLLSKLRRAFEAHMPYSLFLVFVTFGMIFYLTMPSEASMTNGATIRTSREVITKKVTSTTTSASAQKKRVKSFKDD